MQDSTTRIMGLEYVNSVTARTILFAVGIVLVSGCGGGNFCPANPVSREQMPIFALRTLEGSSYTPTDCVAGSEMFADVPATSPFCRWIEEFARRGITGGCGGGNYCPGDSSTRGQMAVFLTATFGL